MFNDKFNKPYVDFLNKNFGKNEHLILCKKWFSEHPFPLGENVIEIKKQVRKVIELLEQRIILEPNRPILKTLYDRYMKAEEIISSNEDISKIMISGGCRAYLDAFSDYMNPLLGEMDKAEKMLSNLKKC